MQESISQEVQEVLSTPKEDIALEQIQDEDSSPLNQPVVEKDIAGEKPPPTKENSNWNIWKPTPNKTGLPNTEAENQPQDYRSHVEAHMAHEKANQPLDAPEQQIKDGATLENRNMVNDHDFKIPLNQTNQAAEAILGMANNVVELGGGYFIKIPKHEEFYEFDEIIEVIDNQNEKNIQRIKLDKEDKALLRPLLAQVLQNKAKQLTPEQQLMGAIISIIAKKAHIVLEVRAENKILEQRILQIIRDEKGTNYQEKESEEDAEIQEEPDIEEFTESNNPKIQSKVTEATAEQVTEEPKPESQWHEKNQEDENQLPIKKKN